MEQSRPAESCSSFSPRWLYAGGVCLAAAAVLGFGMLVGRQGAGPASASPSDEKFVADGKLPAHLFKDWVAPDMALLISGQTFGYLQPCGCSQPQYGGLVRRYNLYKMLEQKGWKIAGIDLGEIYPPKADLPAQANEKFKTTLRALELMNYQDFGLGVPEFKMPLVNGLAEMLALNIPRPRPVSLDLKDPNNVFQALSVRSYDPIKMILPNGATTTVGVASLVGPSVAANLKGVKDVDFFDNGPMIQALLPNLAKEKTDVVILLVHGTDLEAEKIAKLAFAERQKNPALPNVDLIVHTSDFDTGPARPQLVQGTNTRILFMGHKGKDVGVLGLFKKPAGGYELKYELVSLSPAFGTPENQEAGHPVMKVMEDYAKTIKEGDFIEKYRVLRDTHPTQKDPGLIQAGIQAKYVGTKVCAGCHDHAADVWEKSGHSHAFKALVDARNPSLRQFDPECVMCHTVGFKYRGGYADPPAGANAAAIDKHNTNLLNVGCESCHGPGSMHANNPNNPAYYPLINPIKSTNPNFNVLADRFCQGCHDIENDVHWGAQKPFQKSWAKIAHPTPKPANGN